MARSGLTPYPEINAVARLAADWLAAALGERLLGVYIAGSLALGDFDPLTSDVDLVGVTRDALDETDLARLGDLKAWLEQSGGAWGDRVEMAVIAREQLGRWRPGQRLFFFTNHSAPELATQGPDWTLARAILRTRGYSVAGPDPATLFPPVSKRQIATAARQALRHTWADFAADQPWYASTRVFQVFVVETVCRARMSIATGAIPSKPAAMDWAREHLEGEWQPLLARASAWRAAFTDDHDLTPEPQALPETLAFIHDALART